MNSETKKEDLNKSFHPINDEAEHTMNPKDSTPQEHSPEFLEDGDDKTDSLKAELTKLKVEAENNFNQYLRAVAEAENARKRHQKEQANLTRYSLESFFKELLPVLDSFENALHAKYDDQDSAKALASLKEGILLVKKQLLDVLEKNGLTSISAIGEKFNPNLHQAIRKIESNEVSDEQVEEEYAKGYTLYERLLRPSMVSVKVPSSQG